MSVDAEGVINGTSNCSASHYRLLIGEAIGKNANVLAPKLRTQLLKELNNPIAYSGGVVTYPPSIIDLAMGWNVVSDGHIIVAKIEYTEGSASSGDAMQVAVIIRMDANTGNVISTIVVITPVKELIPLNEMKRILLNEPTGQP
jgi:hypothetical protein